MNVPVGIRTKIGYLITLLGLLPAAIKSFETTVLAEGSTAWHSPEKWSAIAGVAALAITKIGGFAQAVVGTKAGSGVIEPPPPGFDPAAAGGEPPAAE